MRRGYYLLDKLEKVLSHYPPQCRKIHKLNEKQTEKKSCLLFIMSERFHLLHTKVYLPLCNAVYGTDR